MHAFGLRAWPVSDELGVGSGSAGLAGTGDGRSIAEDVRDGDGGFRVPGI